VLGEVAADDEPRLVSAGRSGVWVTSYGGTGHRRGGRARVGLLHAQRQGGRARRRPAHSENGAAVVGDDLVVTHPDVRRVYTFPLP
jgi:hypothetical protein